MIWTLISPAPRKARVKAMPRMNFISCGMLIGLFGLSSAGCSEETAAAVADVQDRANELKRKNKHRKKTPPKPKVTKKVDHKARPGGRAAVELTREHFGEGARDPFASKGDEPIEAIEAELPKVRQRNVRMPNYGFQELNLIAIVRSGGSSRARALFVASDGVSKSISQGDYFSRNEVLLAAVNSDYVEIEIVDEELAQGLQLKQGERRAIYLKQE